MRALGGRVAAARTLVGRVALAQVSVGLATLAAMVALSYGAMTFVVRRHLDQGLLSLCALGAKRAAKPGAATRPHKWLIDEMEEHRPIGVRIEVQDASGRLLVADGKGPSLRTPAGRCDTQGEHRVCQSQADGLRFLAAASQASALADRNRMAVVMAAVAAALAMLVVALGRATARRALASLSSMAGRIAAIQPGAGARVGPVGHYEEIDALARSFDALLVRFEASLVTERRFAAEASHELRTPLTVVRGEVEELARLHPGSDFGRALRSMDRLNQLIEALLWLTRSQRPLDRADLAVVNAADVVRDEARVVAATHGGRQVRVDAPDELLVHAHEALLARAVANLIDNAVKHSPADAAVDVHLGARAGQVELHVADRGPGVPSGMRERIFQPFFRGGEARAASEGFGLGLPVAAAIARAHGGSVTLAEGDGPGSRFVLSLPADVSERAAAAPPAPT